MDIFSLVTLLLQIYYVHPVYWLSVGANPSKQSSKPGERRKCWPVASTLTS